MLFVPVGYTFGAGMFKMDSIRGGSPYGAGVFAGDGTRLPNETELALAEHQGKYMAAVVKRLAHSWCPICHFAQLFLSYVTIFVVKIWSVVFCPWDLYQFIYRVITKERKLILVLVNFFIVTMLRAVYGVTFFCQVFLVNKYFASSFVFLKHQLISTVHFMYCLLALWLKQTWIINDMPNILTHEAMNSQGLCQAEGKAILYLIDCSCNSFFLWLNSSIMFELLRGHKIRN